MQRLAVVGVALMVTAGVGCGNDTPEEPASGQRPVAVASVYPAAWIAQRVAPDADVSLLTAGGLEAHDIDLTPAQRASIEEAAVVLYVGDIGFQPQVEEAVKSASGQVVSLAEVAGERVLHAGAHEEHGEEQGEQAGGGAIDAHMWFDPDTMADAVTRAGEAFATADADRAATYRQTAVQLRDEVLALRGELDRLLGGECRFEEAIVSHQAYGYLLRPYDHGQHGITGINPEAGASSAELAEVVAEIKREGIGHVLAEPVEGREDALAVAKEAGIEVLDVSPLDAVTEEQARSGFPELVRQQARQFATALGCQ